MMKQSKENATEIALAALLDVLASILIPLEVTPTRLAQIARVSFIKASALNARIRSSGRPHLARIAALTGLSRAEVKRVVAANYGLLPLEPESSPRAIRVLNAWLTSKGYSRSGKGVPLKVTGAFPSFETLCRDHSGDIPYRVILGELERRNSIKLKLNRTWVSVAENRRIQKSHQPELSNLVFAASIIGELSRSEGVLVKRKERIKASSAIQDSYVENAIASRVASLLDNLPQLFISRQKDKQHTNRVNIYTLVSRCERVRKPRS
jgi:hypothetical protein